MVMILLTYVYSFRDVAKIEAGIGDKVGSFLQFMAMSICGFGIGFAKGWKVRYSSAACESLAHIVIYYVLNLFSYLHSKAYVGHSCGNASLGRFRYIRLSLLSTDVDVFSFTYH